jgi:hypothetical protein
LFWKRKTDDVSLFTYDSRTRRASYRLRPSPDEAVKFTFGGFEHTAVDIGGGGLSFNNKGFAEGNDGPITLKIPGHNHPIPAALKIRCICKNGICHAAFVEIADDDVDKIHLYLLERQKEIARAKRHRRKKTEKSI